jgi:hypothetical protein
MVVDAQLREVSTSIWIWRRWSMGKRYRNGEEILLTDC